jgi:hypothetical protein
LKPIRWSQHALQTLKDRGIDRLEAETTIETPDKIIPGRRPREILVRRYSDPLLQREMALCVLIEETDDERVVITLYKTSQIKKYLEGTPQ